MGFLSLKSVFSLPGGNIGKKWNFTAARFFRERIDRQRVTFYSIPQAGND